MCDYKEEVYLRGSKYFIKECQMIPLLEMYLNLPQGVCRIQLEQPCRSACLGSLSESGLSGPPVCFRKERPLKERKREGKNNNNNKPVNV